MVQVTADKSASHLLSQNALGALIGVGSQIFNVHHYRRATSERHFAEACGWFQPSHSVMSWFSRSGAF